MPYAAGDCYDAVCSATQTFCVGRAVLSYKAAFAGSRLRTSSAYSGPQPQTIP